MRAPRRVPGAPLSNNPNYRITGSQLEGNRKGYTDTEGQASRQVQSLRNSRESKGWLRDEDQNAAHQDVGVQPKQHCRPHTSACT